MSGRSGSPGHPIGRKDYVKALTDKALNFHGNSIAACKPLQSLRAPKGVKESYGPALRVIPYQLVPVLFSFVPCSADKDPTRWRSCFTSPQRETQFGNQPECR